MKKLILKTKLAKLLKEHYAINDRIKQIEDLYTLRFGNVTYEMIKEEGLYFNMYKRLTSRLQQLMWEETTIIHDLNEPEAYAQMEELNAILENELVKMRALA